jgi:uncharacterized protein (DUF1778 family)
MATNQPTRTACLETRITPDALAVVRHAADLHGSGVGDFVVTAAQATAHQGIEATRIIRLSAGDQAFVDLPLRPEDRNPHGDCRQRPGWFGSKSQSKLTPVFLRKATKKSTVGSRSPRS